ncbi:MAG: VOC family protein [Mycobacterium sp.]|nr:VOC family protein [Mycobacterium sp.]
MTRTRWKTAALCTAALCAALAATTLYLAITPPTPERTPIMTRTVNAVTFDAENPAALARFWSAVFDTPVDDSSGGDVVSVGAKTLTPFLVFQRVDERSTGLNRVHADYFVADLDAETERLLGLGATLVQKFDLGELKFTKFTDPEGNQFDVSNEG